MERNEDKEENSPMEENKTKCEEGKTFTSHLYYVYLSHISYHLIIHLCCHILPLQLRHLTFNILSTSGGFAVQFRMCNHQGFSSVTFHRVSLTVSQKSLCTDVIFYVSYGENHDNSCIDFLTQYVMFIDIRKVLLFAVHILFHILHIMSFSRAQLFL